MQSCFLDLSCASEFHFENSKDCRILTGDVFEASVHIICVGWTRGNELLENVMKKS